MCERLRQGERGPAIADEIEALIEASRPNDGDTLPGRAEGERVTPGGVIVPTPLGPVRHVHVAGPGFDVQRDRVVGSDEPLEGEVLGPAPTFAEFTRETLRSATRGAGLAMGFCPRCGLVATPITHTDLGDEASLCWGCMSARRGEPNAWIDPSRVSGGEGEPVVRTGAEEDDWFGTGDGAPELLEAPAGLVRTEAPELLEGAVLEELDARAVLTGKACPVCGAPPGTPCDAGLHG